MTITINGTIKSGPSWEALDDLLESMIGEGRLTQISRVDGKANYRATAGVYRCTFTPDHSDDVQLTLRINE